MNREQRRAYEKKLRRSGVTKNVAKEWVTKNLGNNPIEEGSKVKINYDFMIRNPWYRKQTTEFKRFCEENKDKVFTVEYNKDKVAENAPDYKYNVNFVEDTNEPKFLFYTDTLTRMVTAKVNMDNGDTNEFYVDPTSTNGTQEDIVAKVQETINQNKSDSQE